MAGQRQASGGDTNPRALHPFRDQSVDLARKVTATPRRIVVHYGDNADAAEHVSSDDPADCWCEMVIIPRRNQHMSRSMSLQHHAWHLVVGTAGIVAIFGAVGCSVAPAGHPASDGSSATTQPVAAISTPATSSGNKAAAILTWYAGPGGKDLNKVGSAMSHFASAATTASQSAEVAACQAIGNAVTAAQAVPPIPLASSERWHRAALAQYAHGAADCQAGSSVLSPSVIEQAAMQFDKGNADLDRATTAIKTLSSGS